MQLNELELVKYQQQYQQIPTFNPNEYEAELALEQPTAIHFSENLQRDNKGNLVTKHISPVDLEKTITASREFPFTFREGVFTKRTHAKNNYSLTFQYNQPSITAKDFASKVAVIKINDEVGYGLFVIDRMGLPSGTKIYYSSYKSPKDEPAKLIDTYLLESQNSHFSSLHIGGLQRFIQGAPRRKQLYLYSLKIPENKVATSNIEFKCDANDNCFYETTNDIPYGTQLLAYWDFSYWNVLQKAFRVRQQLFDHNGVPLSKEVYEPPILLTLSPTDTKVIPVAELPKLISVSKQAGIPKEELTNLRTYIPQRFQPIFSSEIPTLEQWRNFNNDSRFKSPCQQYHLHFDTSASAEFFINVNNTAIAAYKAKDFKTTIKLSTWLVLQESMVPDKSQKHDKLASYYWNLGNAYWHWDNHSHYETAFYLLSLAAKYETGYTERVEKRITEYQDILSNSSSSTCECM